jgi:hypothetical protein
VQEGQPPGYIFYTSSGSSSDSGVKGKVQVQWILDSGASEHYVKESVPICNKKYLKHPISVTIAKKDKKLVSNVIGDVYCETFVNGKQEWITIKDVLVVSNLTMNLLLVDKTEKKGLKIVFENNKRLIYYKNNIVAEAIGERGTYKLNTEIEWEEPSANLVQNNAELWHLRMGHLGWNNLKKFGDMVDGVNIEGTPPNVYQVCQEGKQTKLPYNTQRVRVKRPLERIHSDVVGPISPIGYDGSRYMYIDTC